MVEHVARLLTDSRSREVRWKLEFLGVQPRMLDLRQPESKQISLPALVADASSQFPQTQPLPEATYAFEQASPGAGIAVFEVASVTPEGCCAFRRALPRLRRRADFFLAAERPLSVPFADMVFR